MKKLRYAAEALLVYILYVIFKMLPAPMASNLGGFLGRSIGPKLSASRKARRHIQIAFPAIKYDQETRILIDMWDNLGRLFAEYPHLKTISEKYTTIENKEIVLNAVNADKPALFIGGHIGNWEINASTTYWQLKQAVDLTFRAPNNPWVAKILAKARTFNGKLNAYPKERESAALLIKAMRNNHSLGILVDQKYNPGVEAEFFGKAAMTNTIFITLAQKFDAPIIPVRCVRNGGCNFTLHVYEPIPAFHENGNKRDPLDIISDTHALLEKWITEHPAQWIWLHKRWK